MKAHKPNVWVVAVLMGLGHLRAAYPFRQIAIQDIIIYGARQFTPPSEYQKWRRLRRLYYLFSRAGTLKVIGRVALSLMLAIDRIPPLYPRRDRSRPNLAVRYLDFLIREKGFCQGLALKVSYAVAPVLHTFYATAVALDRLTYHNQRHYLIISDADINRVWVPIRPRESQLIYLAPCTQVKQRLLSYGVSEDRIYITGFPLPIENLGSPEKLEILKADLFERLLRLDPGRKFFAKHTASVLNWLERQPVPEQDEDFFTLMFAIGGAGAQMQMAGLILKSLKEKIEEGKIRLIISCGTQKLAFENVLRALNTLGLGASLGRGLEIIFDHNVYTYFEKFNLALRRVDVLWTKPSELSFYCGLGIPILMAPPIGTHEERNRRWLMEIHAGVEPPGRVEDCGEWLFDLRENGRLAEAAWDGFLKARKLGTYKIMDLLQTGQFNDDQYPLDQ